LVIQSRNPLSKQDVAGLKKQVGSMLRLDESLESFYATLARVAANGEFDWIRRERAGRLLRGPDPFEDVVKMICTTNCAWSATERMVANLVNKLGTRFDEEHADFPTAEQLAGATRLLAGDGQAIRPLSVGLPSSRKWEAGLQLLPVSARINSMERLSQSKALARMQRTCASLRPLSTSVDSWCRLSTPDY
jgi:hypothetical protein